MGLGVGFVLVGFWFGFPPRAKPLQAYNHSYSYTSTLQKAPKEGSQTRTLPTQTYTHNNNYTSTPQKVQKEGGPPRAKPLQAYNHSYNYTSTLQKAPKEGGPSRTLPPQTYNHNYNYTSNLQKIEEKTPLRHQSKPVEAPATYQALSSASVTICAAVAATIPMSDCPATVSFQCNIPIGAFPR